MGSPFLGGGGGGFEPEPDEEGAAILKTLSVEKRELFEPIEPEGLVQLELDILMGVQARET